MSNCGLCGRAPCECALEGFPHIGAPVPAAPQPEQSEELRRFTVEICNCEIGPHLTQKQEADGEWVQWRNVEPLLRSRPAPALSEEHATELRRCFRYALDCAFQAGHDTALADEPDAPDFRAVREATVPSHVESLLLAVRSALSASPSAHD